MRTANVMACAVAAWPLLASAQETGPMRCVLELSTDSYAGQCHEENGASLFLRLHRVDGRDPFVLEGSWGQEPSSDPRAVVSLAPSSATFHPAGVIDVYSPGWISLREYSEGDGRLEFSFLWDKAEGPLPLELDRRIVERAWETLASSEWDREDDRQCSPNDTARSLYCALVDATAEVMGRPHDGQTALRVVRGVISVFHRDRVKGHSLMDFNNHPDTTLDDVRVVLERSADAMRRAMEDPSLWPPSDRLYRSRGS